MFWKTTEFCDWILFFVNLWGKINLNLFTTWNERYVYTFAWNILSAKVVLGSVNRWPAQKVNQNIFMVVHYFFQKALSFCPTFPQLWLILPSDFISLSNGRPSSRTKSFRWIENNLFRKLFVNLQIIVFPRVRFT